MFIDASLAMQSFGFKMLHHYCYAARPTEEQIKAKDLSEANLRINTYKFYKDLYFRYGRWLQYTKNLFLEYRWRARLYEMETYGTTLNYYNKIDYDHS